MNFIGELKSESLVHDSSAGDLRVWKKKSESHYSASNMHLCQLNVQHSGHHAGSGGRPYVLEHSNQQF